MKPTPKPPNMQQEEKVKELIEGIWREGYFAGKHSLTEHVMAGYNFRNEEVERLKGLIEEAYIEGTKRHLHPDEHHFWPKFKEEHNL